MTSTSHDANARRRIVPWLFLLAAGLCIRAFFDAGILHGRYWLPYGLGLSEIPANELMLYSWYVLFGGLAVAFMAGAFVNTRIPERIETAGRWLIAHPRVLLCACAAIVATVGFAVWRFVLQTSPVSDDELSYAFIAKTLLQGRVVNPSPGDEAFFHNQFVVLNGAGWFGKYPIGHPALLAIGELFHVRFVVPLVASVASLLLTFAIARRMFDARIATIATCLLALSPHFTFTAGTQLSQTTSTTMMLLGLWAMVRLAEQPRLCWALIGGIGWGYGILIRPLPNGLFLLVAVAAFLLALPAARVLDDKPALFGSDNWPQRLRLLLIAAIPVALCGALFLWVNAQQTGDVLKTGYHALGNDFGPLALNKKGEISVSFGAALLRQNFWLLGWPLSLLFLPFAFNRRLAILWGLVAATYAYRFITPKAVVATTGPVYVTEIVPLLAMMSAVGMLKAKRLLSRCASPRAKAWVLSVVIAAFCVSSATFIVVHLKNMHRSGSVWQIPFRRIEAHHAKPALVFAPTMVATQGGNSWAYFPPNPSPTFDDDIIFVRMPLRQRADGRQVFDVPRAIEFWRRRFPHRSAWMYYHRGPQPVFKRMPTRTE